MVTVLPVSQIGTPSSGIQPGPQESGNRGLNGRTSRRRGCQLHPLGQTNQAGGPHGHIHHRSPDVTGVLESGPLHVGSPLRIQLQANHRIERHGHYGGRSIQKAVSPRQPDSVESIGAETGEVKQGVNQGLHHRRHHRSHSPNALNTRARHLHPSEISDRALNGHRGHHHHGTRSPGSLNNSRAHGHSSRRHGIHPSTVQSEPKLDAPRLGSLSLDSQ